MEYNPLRYIDPNGMNVDKPSDHWGEGVENSIKRNRQEKQQESTWNTLAQVGNYLQKGMEMIFNGAKEEVDGLFNRVSSGTQVAIKDGPSELSSISDDVNTAGLLIAGGISAAGQPEIGLGCLVFANRVSLGLNATAMGLSYINYYQNPTMENYTSLSTYTENTVNSLIYGDMVDKIFVKGMSTAGEAIKTTWNYRSLIITF